MFLDLLKMRSEYGKILVVSASARISVFPDAPNFIVIIAETCTFIVAVAVIMIVFSLLHEFTCSEIILSIDSVRLYFPRTLTVDEIVLFAAFG